MSVWDPDRQQWVQPPQVEQRPRPVPPQPEPGRPRGRRRVPRSMVVAAAAAVVLGGGLGFGSRVLLAAHDGRDAHRAPSPPPASTAAAPPAATPTPTPTPTPQPRTVEPTVTTVAPTGQRAAPFYRRVHESRGYSIDVPAAWHRSTERDSVFYKPADDSGVIQVYALTEPELTPYTALVETERYVSANNGYGRIRLEQVAAPDGGDAAEFEYYRTRNDGSVRRVLIQAFSTPDGGKYALLVGGTEADWSRYQDIAAVLRSSFCLDGYCGPGR